MMNSAYKGQCILEPKDLPLSACRIKEKARIIMNFNCCIPNKYEVGNKQEIA